MMNQRMRNTVIFLAMMPALSAIAQQSTPQTPAGSNWQNVVALPEGTSVRVKATSRSAVCKLKSVDAESLTCVHGAGQDIVFQRAEVKSITIHHHGRSAAVGAGVGFVAGAGMGYGVARGGLGGDWAGTVAAGAGIGFGLIGAVIGVATDFTHSTVYKGP